MPAKYYVTLTNYGTELVAAAHDLQSITLTEMVIGDANGIPYQPIDHTNLTQLVHQTAAVEIREVKVENNSATVSAIIPANMGGFNIHEIGLKDASGKLVYIGNYHGAYKPVIAEGGGGELELVIDIKATAGAQALIEVNPLIISATKTWVLEKFNELMEAINNKEDIKVGDLFITTLNFADSTAVAAHKKYGVWEKFGDGHALVARASDTNELAPEFMKTIGHSDGEYQHKITKSEMPEHDHIDEGSPYNKLVASLGDIIPGDGDGMGGINPAGTASPNYNSTYLQTSDITAAQFTKMTIKKNGAGQAHNNIQPSIIVDVWKRTA